MVQTDAEQRNTVFEVSMTLHEWLTGELDKTEYIEAIRTIVRRTHSVIPSLWAKESAR